MAETVARVEEMDEKDERRIAGLEARLRQLEDNLAICQLLAGYGPAVDSRSAEATAEIWTQSGRYDYGGDPLEGAGNIGDLVDLDTHVGYVERGCAHVIAMPMVTVDGDRAVATGYSRIYLRDGTAWKVERASANRWELVRTEAGWKVESRINRLLDGSSQGRELLRRAISERKPRKEEK